MEELPHASAVADMWVLITLVLWAAVSVPLALLAGRSLRSSRPPSVADEAEAFLRGRTHRRSRLAWSGGFAVAVALTVGVVVVSSEAMSQLPAAHLAATRGLDRLVGNSTTTTTSTTEAPPAATATVPVDDEPAPRVEGTARRRAPAAPDRETADPTPQEVRAGATATVTPDDRPDDRREGSAETTEASRDPSEDDDRRERFERGERERRRARAWDGDEDDEDERRSAPTTTSTTTTPPSTTTTTTEPQTETGTTTTTTGDPDDDDERDD